MRKHSWLFVLPLVAAMLWGGASPGQAVDQLWKIGKVNSFGCNDNSWNFDATFSGLQAPDYIAHTVVTSDGLVYMNEAVPGIENQSTDWSLYNDTSYGPTTGAYPMPAGKQMKAVFTLERPKGNVISSWTIVAKSCDSKELLWNGRSAEDADGDFVTVYKDACPTLPSSRANGCPARARTLTMAAAYGPKRVVGQLTAPGYPALASGRSVVLWKVKPGPDQRVGSTRTGAGGGFRFRVTAGKYYAKTPGVILPKVGQSYAKQTVVVTVK